MRVELHRLQGVRNPVALLEYEPRRPRDVCLVAAHGYSSSKHNLDFLCSFLSSHGYRVLSLDLPGHKLGASGGRLNGIDDLVDAMGAAVRFAREGATSRLYCMGHSLGAMTALLVGGADPAIAGTIAIATGYGRPTALADLQQRGVTDFRASYVDGLPLPELLCGVDERLTDALERLRGRPGLYLAASRDAMVSVASVEQLYDRASEPKTFITVESDHTNAGENARAAVLQWLNERHPRS